MMAVRSVPIIESDRNDAEIVRMESMDRIAQVATILKAIKHVEPRQPGAIGGDLRAELAHVGLDLAQQRHNEADCDGTHMTRSES